MPEPAPFRAADFAVVRISLLAGGPAAPRPPADPDALGELREFLRQVVAVPVVREAVAVSSASLDATLDKVAAGDPVEPKKLRRAALAATRYLARMTYRPTPFGLMAGVAAARIDDDPRVRIGTGHGRHAFADMGWLTELVRAWERDPEVLARLRLVANDLCFVRADRLVLPYVRADGEDTGPDDRECTARYTRPVQVTLEAARSPVGHGELVDRLLAGFPDAGRTEVERVLGHLVEREFLLTDLRPPATAADPVRHVLDKLRGVPGHAGRAALAGAHRALADYAASPVGAGHGAWRSAVKALGRLRAGDRPIQVDLRMDADIVLPREVGAELGRAAAVAWRLAPAAAPLDPLADYRADFVERYGTAAVVPVKELLDPQTGIGPPAGYLLPPGPRRAAGRDTAPAHRDTLLAGLAQRAAARGVREVVLDDDLVERLAQRGAEDQPSCYLEANAQLLADSEGALRSGDFRLVLAPSNLTYPGPMFGRFLHLLPQLREPVAQTAALLVSDGGEATPAQLIGPMVRSRNVNVARVPPLTRQSVQAGVFADRTGPDVLGLDELAVGADLDRFYLVSTRTGREVVPLPFHALNVRVSTPNAVRLLVEIGQSRTPPWPVWSWGQAERLPYLPRVRRGRTVLAPARWLVDPALTGAGPSWAQWLRAFGRWRADWAVPDTVYAVAGDRRIRLDLTSAAQLRLLRDDLRKHPGTLLQEEPLGGEVGTGWIGGHANEVVVPLLPARRRQRPVPVALPCPPLVTGATRIAHPPGGEWLYAKVYAGTGRHTDLVTRHLPELVERAGPVADRWFFLRYRDDEPHLRVRFHGEPDALNGRLLPALHDWADRLSRAGTIRELTLGTYRPEVHRYGGPDAFPAAERAFDADSRSVLEQLALRAEGPLTLPLEVLAAANILDLAARLEPAGWPAWLLDTFPKGTHHRAFQQHRRLATLLLDPTGRWAELARLPGGDLLLDCFRRRAPAVTEYGRVIRGLVARGRMDSATGAFASVLHLHHNRLVGIDPASEQSCQAIARGAVQAHLDRERHLNR